MENYEQKYKDALRRAKKLQETCDSTSVVGWCEYLFPELKEPKDEQIRKWLINEIKVKHHNLDEENIEFVDKAIAWLEKQGEQRQLHLQEMPHWISVEDELPRCYIPYNNWDGTPSDVLESEKVIVLLSDGTICIATFNQNLDVDTDNPTGSPYWFDEGNPEDGDRIRGEVTHWMPLPQPPKKETNKKGGEKWHKKI